MDAILVNPAFPTINLVEEHCEPHPNQPMASPSSNCSNWRIGAANMQVGLSQNALNLADSVSRISQRTGNDVVHEVTSLTNKDQYLSANLLITQQVSENIRVGISNNAYIIGFIFDLVVPNLELLVYGESQLIFGFTAPTETQGLTWGFTLKPGIRSYQGVDDDALQILQDKRIIRPKDSMHTGMFASSDFGMHYEFDLDEDSELAIAFTASDWLDVGLPTPKAFEMNPGSPPTKTPTIQAGATYGRGFPEVSHLMPKVFIHSRAGLHVDERFFGAIGIETVWLEYLSTGIGIDGENFCAGLGFNSPFLQAHYAIRRTERHQADPGSLQHHLQFSLSYVF